MFGLIPLIGQAIVLFISLVTAILAGAIALVGGYSVYSNSGEDGIDRIAGIMQMVGGVLQMTYFCSPLSLFCCYPASLLLQFLGMLRA